MNKFSKKRFVHPEYLKQATSGDLQVTCIECDCGEDAEIVDGTDDGSSGQFCFNLYLCNGCGSIYKEDIVYQCFYKLDNLNYLTRIEETKED